MRYEGGSFACVYTVPKLHLKPVCAFYKSHLCVSLCTVLQNLMCEWHTADLCVAETLTCFFVCLQSRRCVWQGLGETLHVHVNIILNEFLCKALFSQQIKCTLYKYGYYVDCIMMKSYIFSQWSLLWELLWASIMSPENTSVSSSLVYFGPKWEQASQTESCHHLGFLFGLLKQLDTKADGSFVPLF